jgi:hypothetical protein
MTEMENEYRRAEQQNNDLLAQQIEQAIPGASVRNYGWIIIVALENKSVFSLAPLTAELVDVSGKDCFEQEYEYPSISWEQCIGFLAQVNALSPSTSEKTGMGALPPHDTRGAFAPPGQKSNLGTEQSEREGWTRIGEAKKRDQSGRKSGSRLENAFGDDPLGADRYETKPNKRSEGRRASPIGHNFAGGSPLALNESGSTHSGGKAEIMETARMAYGSALFSYLKEVLPLADDECFADDAGNIIVACDVLRLQVIPKGENLFDVLTFIGDKAEPRQVQLSYGETVRYVFDLVSVVEKGNPPTSAKAQDDGEEVESSDAYQVLRELAGELGKPKDIFRNKDLINLRSGLLTEAKTRTSTPDALLCGLDAHLRRFADLRRDGQGAESTASPKAEWFRGAPVSIGGGMDGKTLRYVENLGAVIVEKKELPLSDEMKLSWDSEQGAVLVPVAETTQRPSWKPFR